MIEKFSDCTRMLISSMLSSEEEETLWSVGVRGVSSHKALLHAIFFLDGKNACLRGGQEHKDLKLSQFVRGVDH